ncbi:O-acetylserine/cysteine efflux transporter [Pedobacter sp. UYP24]
MSNTTSLSPKHLLVALSVVLIWGINFIAIHVGLKGFPPFLLCGVRFGLSALPWVFILPRPKSPIKLIVAYGIFTFTLQFGFLFSGIHLGLSPGLASLILQIQVFFSIGLAFLFFKDKPSPWKIYGSLISFIGIGIVASNVPGGSTFIGFVFTLFAALSWAFGNIYTKKVHADSPLSLVVWGNLMAFPFMVIASLVFDGPVLIQSSLQNISWPTIGAIVYIVYISTHVGYGAWGFLLKAYPTSVVVPFTLLIPVVGFLSSAIFLGEDLSTWKLLASLFIMGGVVFNLLEPQIRKLLQHTIAKKAH